MTFIFKKTILGAASLATAATFSAVASAQSTPLANENRDKVAFSQPLDPGQTLQLGEARAVATSRSYYQRVSGAELAKGVEIVTQAPGAVIRLTPVQSNGALPDKTGANLRTSDLLLSSGRSEPVSIERSGALVADQAALRASHPDLFENTIAFETPTALGQGRLTLRSQQNLGAGQVYMVHVFDRNSQREFLAESERQHYFESDGLVVRTSLSGASRKQRAEATAVLLGPDGQRFALQATQNGGALEIAGKLPGKISVSPGELWRVAIRYRETEGETPLYRDVELPIAVGLQSAQIRSVKAAGNELSVNVRVKEAGRYEVRAWIFASRGKSEPEGAMLTYGAEWLEAGQRTMTVAPDFSALAAKGYEPPYQIRQLQLLDQSRLMALDTETSEDLPVFEK
ncbi:MAG: DUF4785 domain-containing protein [Pseudomonadota bacterium]